MKKLGIIPLCKSPTLLPEFIQDGTICYFLSDDFSTYGKLKYKLFPSANIKTLSGMFDETLQETIGSYQELISEINKNSKSRFWWGHHVASKSSTATPLFTQVVSLLCAKKILSRATSDLIFIIDGDALIACIDGLAKSLNWNVTNKQDRIGAQFRAIKWKLKDVLRASYFIFRSFQKKYLASKIIAPVTESRDGNHPKRVLFRSWITQGTFHPKTGDFEDRNFGQLPLFMEKHGYEVWTMPMLFNLDMPIRDLFKQMADAEENFLIPELYLSFGDVFRVLSHAYSNSIRRFNSLILCDIDISPLVNEVMGRIGLNHSLSELNLCYFALKRLKERGFEIDTFLYAFENNAAEKLFILGCKDYYPDAKVMGFQHTAYFPNNMAVRLGKDEYLIHPLPDKIVCSGPIYQQLFEEAGFPKETLVAGQNLRFRSVDSRFARVNSSVSTKMRKILLTLSYDYNQAFELFLKIKEVLEQSHCYEVIIRSHPLLEIKKIREFLDLINFGPYTFAEGGTLQEWLTHMYAYIPAGASIATIEAVVFGIPVIRVLHDNSITYDAFDWSGYPFKPVNSVDEIRQQLEQIALLQAQNSEAFIKLRDEVSGAFFTPPTETNLAVYL